MLRALCSLTTKSVSEVTVDLGVNLAAALIGLMAGKFISEARHRLLDRAARRFWCPTRAKKIFVLVGSWQKALSNAGEVEPVVNLQDALTLGELRRYLERFYSQVVVVTELSAVEPNLPVVSLGGPLVNPLTKSIGESGVLPLWFHGLPYIKNSDRVLTDPGLAEFFRSTFSPANELVADIGFVARLKLQPNDDHFAFIIAGNYGMGLLGAVRHVTDSRKLASLSTLTHGCTEMQLMVRTFIKANRIDRTELVTVKRIK